MNRPVLLAFLLAIALSPLQSARAQANDLDCAKCVETGDIAGAAVTTFKLKNQAETTSKLAKQAVSTGKLQNGAVTEQKLSPAVAAAIQSAGNPLVVDGSDVVIGQLISIGENRWSMEVITDKGYLVSLTAAYADLSDGGMYIASDDCSDTGYVDFGTFGGYVTNLFDGGGVKSLYYVAKTSLPIENFNYGSVTYNEEGCVTQSGQTTVYPVLPNDPNITGVSTDQFTPPLRVELSAP